MKLIQMMMAKMKMKQKYKEDMSLRRMIRLKSHMVSRA